jgi:hypothetical protein
VRNCLGAGPATGRSRKRELIRGSDPKAHPHCAAPDRPVAALLPSSRSVLPGYCSRQRQHVGRRLNLCKYYEGQTGTGTPVPSALPTLLHRILAPLRGQKEEVQTASFSHLRVLVRARGRLRKPSIFRHFGGSDRSRADAVTGDKSMVLAIFPSICGASRRTGARPTANRATASVLCKTAAVPNYNKSPFRCRAGAPSRSLFVDPGGQNRAAERSRSSVMTIPGKSPVPRKGPRSTPPGPVGACISENARASGNSYLHGHRRVWGSRR